jgi:copper transport protein
VSETTPVDGAVTAKRPELVEIVFNERVSLAPGSVRLIAADGQETVLQELTNSPEGSGSRARWSLSDKLPTGWYAVSWRAVSEDGHGIQGSFTFYYGDPSIAGDTQRADQLADPTRPFVLASHALRVLSYLSVLLAVGFLAALWAVGGPAAAGVGEIARTLRRAATVAAVAGLVLTPLTLLNNALLLNGGSTESLRVIVQIVMQSSSGAALLVRMSALFGLCTAVLLLAETGTKKIGAMITVLASGALAASFAMGGHAAVVPWRWVASVASVLHLSAGALWLGGIPAVAWVVWRRHQVSPALVPEVINRFSRLATISVILVFIGGGVLSASMLTSPADLVTTRYGVTLLIKFALVGIVGLIGAYNHFFLVPALRRTLPGASELISSGSVPSDTSPETDTSLALAVPVVSSNAAQAHLRVSLLIEALFVVLIAIATGALTSSSAPAAGGSHLSHLGGSSHGGHGGSDFDVTLALEDLEPKIVQAPLGDGELRLDYLPGRTNTENRFRVSVTDANGDERTLSAVDVSFSQTELAIGPLTRSFERQEDGTWVLVTRDLGVPGTWKAELLVSLDDDQLDTVTLDVVIQPARVTGGGMP